MRLSLRRSLATWAGVLVLAAPIPGAGTPQEAPPAESTRRAPVLLKTGLFGLAPQEAMVVRALEARRGAAASQLQVVFLDERDQVVKRETQSFAPGRPATFRVSHAELGTGGDVPAVRVEMVLSQGSSTSQVFLNVEFHNLDTLTVEHRGPFCSPPEGTRIQPNCSGGIGVFPDLEGS